MSNSQQPIKSSISSYEEKTHDLDQHARVAAAKTVLIVEDEVDFANAIRDYLQDYGYQVDTATDGVQGVKQIMVKDYAVILCDMVMPNLAGDMFYTAVERIKPQLCKRFIFMTGYRDDKKVDLFIRKVRGLILWKPFKFHVLMETIQAVEKKVERTAESQ